MSNSKFTKGRPPKKHYLPVPNDLIRDKSVSDGAFRIICWINSHHDDFEVTFTGIQKAFSYGRDKLRAIVKNGIEAGYIVRQRFNDATTGLLGWIYAAFTSTEEAKEFAQSLANKPSTENPAMDDKPCPENPATVHPAMVNQGMATYIDQEDQKEENNFLEEDPPIVPRAIAVIVKEGGSVSDTPQLKSVSEQNRVTPDPSPIITQDLTTVIVESVLEQIVPARENNSLSQTKPNGSEQFPWEQIDPVKGWVIETGFLGYVAIAVKDYSQFKDLPVRRFQREVVNYLNKAHFDNERRCKVFGYWQDYQDEPVADTGILSPTITQITKQVEQDKELQRIQNASKRKFTL